MAKILFLLFTATACFVGCGSEATTTGSGSTASDSNSSAQTTVSALDIWVVNGGDASISKINTDTGIVTATYPLPNASFPHHINMSKDGKVVSVAVPGMDLSQGHAMTMDSNTPGAVYLLDGSTGVVIKTKKLANMNHNAAFSPDQKTIWTSQMVMPGHVLVLDATTLEQQAAIPVGDSPEEVTFSYDGKTAFSANGMSNNVSIIDVSSLKVVATLNVPEGLVGAWGAYDNRMYLDSETAKSITIIDASTRAIVKSFDLGFTPGMASLDKAGNLWVTNSDAGNVTIFDLSTFKQMMSIVTGPGAHGIAFSPDGLKAVVSNQLGDSVTVIDANKMAALQTIKVGSKPNGVMFKPAI